MPWTTGILSYGSDRDIRHSQIDTITCWVAVASIADLRFTSPISTPGSMIGSWRIELRGPAEHRALRLDACDPPRTPFRQCVDTKY